MCVCAESDIIRIYNTSQRRLKWCHIGSYYDGHALHLRIGRKLYQNDMVTSIGEKQNPTSMDRAHRSEMWRAISIWFFKSFYPVIGSTKISGSIRRRENENSLHLLPCLVRKRKNNTGTCSVKKNVLKNLVNPHSRFNTNLWKKWAKSKNNVSVMCVCLSVCSLSALLNLSRG